VSLSAPLLELSDRKIVAGVWLLKSTFEVEKPPRTRDDGLWTVTVDGQELIKADPLGRDPRATMVPPPNRLRALVAEALRRLDCRRAHCTVIHRQVARIGAALECLRWRLSSRGEDWIGG
jgi:hypothetical protein